MPMRRISAVVLVLISLSIVVVVPTESTYAIDWKYGERLQIPNLPPPPSRLGCYRRSETGRWVSVPCLSQEWIRENVPPPTDGYGKIYGIGYGTTADSPLITAAFVAVQFVKFSGETDTIYGDGAYSIQTNTNTFTGPYNHEAWVQFVYQNLPSAETPFSVLCTWVIDITTEDYWTHTVCMKPPVESLSSTYSATVIGYSVRSIVMSGTTAPYVFFSSSLSTVAILPHGIYAVVAPDAFGLHDNWHGVSGTIIGVGGGSQAVFTSPTSVTTGVAASSCKTLPVISLVKCAPGNAASYYYTSGITAESNNLALLEIPPTLVCANPASWYANWCLLTSRSGV